jgi:hypothetical protein
MRKSGKTVTQEKHNVLPRPSGELTCSESQVEDMFSPGESTDEERIEIRHKSIALSRRRPSIRPFGGLSSETRQALKRPRK